MGQIRGENIERGMKFFYNASPPLPPSPPKGNSEMVALHEYASIRVLMTHFFYN